MLDRRILLVRTRAGADSLSRLGGWAILVSRLTGYSGTRALRARSAGDVRLRSLGKCRRSGKRQSEYKPACSAPHRESSFKRNSEARVAATFHSNARSPHAFLHCSRYPEGGTDQVSHDHQRNTLLRWAWRRSGLSRAVQSHFCWPATCRSAHHRFCRVGGGPPVVAIPEAVSSS